MQGLQQTEFEALKEKIKDIKFASLTTLELDGDLHSRPMSTHDVDADGTLWFLTYKNSNKVREIQANNRVSLSYADHSADTYVAASGTAQVVDDRQKIHELWNDGLKAWFPDGPDDPNITLLRVKPHQAEYWDRPGGKMMTLFEMAKAALTGQPDQSARDVKLGDEPR
jgi:general stress protein 26